MISGKDNNTLLAKQ